MEGGDKTGSATRLMAPFLTARGIALASVNYRMYPTARYPDFVEDAAHAVAWVSRNIGAYGRYQRIVVGGSSAGGYLSMMLCFDPRWYATCGEFPVPVTAYVHDAGQPTCHYNVLRERGIDPGRVIVDDSAPLYHVGTSESYPPMLFIVSDNDMENRYEQTELMRSTLRHFGHGDKISYRLMHGKHCAYNKAVDETGSSVLGSLVSSFIESLEK